MPVKKLGLAGIKTLTEIGFGQEPDEKGLGLSGGRFTDPLAKLLKHLYQQTVQRQDGKAGVTTLYQSTLLFARR